MKQQAQRDFLPEGYKRCSGTYSVCGNLIKPKSQFPWANIGIRYHNICKECKKWYERKYRYENNYKVNRRKKELNQTNRERYLEVKRKSYSKNKDQHGKYSKEWKSNHPESLKMYEMTRRARIAGCKINDLTAQQIREILAPGKCDNCRSECKVSLDHITPLSRGGDNTKDNCQALCRSCNSRKWAHILQDGLQLRLDSFFNPSIKAAS